MVGIARSCGCWAGLAVAVVAARGQDDGPRRDSVPDPLTAGQNLVLDRLLRLEDRMFRLSESLAESQPEQSERLAQGIRLAHERLIRDQIEAAIEALKSGDFERAAEIQGRISGDLRAVFDVLTADTMSPEERRARIERLERFLKELDQLTEEEESARARAAVSVDRDESGLKIESPPGRRTDGESDLEEQARAQEELARKTEEMADRMSGSDRAVQESPGDGGSGSRRRFGQKAAEPVDGAESVRRAGDQMERAVRELDAGRPGKALEPQDRAIQELEQARREIQRQLDRERQAEREERLTGLERRFREMLNTQERITRETAALGLVPEASWSRVEILKFVELSDGETALAEEAARAVHILEDDGTTVIFPEVIESIEQDIRRTGLLLAERQAGAETAGLQAEIEVALRDVVEAVEQQRRASQGQSGGSSSMAGAPRLLPGSAELKLLRSMQQRITDRTRRVGTQNTEATTDQTKALSAQQRRVAGLAARIEERTNRP